MIKSPRKRRKTVQAHLLTGDTKPIIMTILCKYLQKINAFKEQNIYKNT